MTLYVQEQISIAPRFSRTSAEQHSIAEPSQILWPNCSAKVRLNRTSTYLKFIHVSISRRMVRFLHYITSASVSDSMVLYKTCIIIIIYS